MRKIISASAILLFFIACNNSGSRDGSMNEGSGASASDTTPMNEMAGFKFSYTIANLPSPLMVLDEFSKAGLPVNTGMLNPTENLNKYHTSLKHAFNYGVYGMDLGYLVVNNRTLEALQYYNTAKKLADALNMTETFNRFVNRFEANSANKDSLTRVVDEAYTATDAYLRSNERLITASQVLAGSWLECQYITVSLLKDSERNAKNEMLYQRIWEQRLYLENISKLLDEFKDDAELVKIKNEYASLLSIYKEPADAGQITKEYLEKLYARLNSVRNLIVT